MRTFKLTVASPDGSRFAGDCVRLDVRGVEGELAVMAGHIPFMTSIVPGACTIWLDESTPKKAHTDGGLLSVAADSVTLLSGSFRFTEESEKETR